MGFKDVVDVSKLQKGTTAKNYKDMCNLLGCEPCKGNGNDREYQIKNWQRYFNFKKEGYKFLLSPKMQTVCETFIKLITSSVCNSLSIGTTTPTMLAAK